MNLLQAKSALSLVRDREDPQVNSVTSSFESFNIPDANLIMRSSDLVDFRVHESVLALASPFLKDLLSSSRLYGSEPVDMYPVVQFPESSELLNCLVTMLYPVRTVMPNSYEKVLYFLVTRWW